MKKRVFILLLAVFNAVGVYAITTISKNTIQSGTQTINGSVIVNRGVTYTINGDLTVNGDFTANGATIIINGTLHVTGNYNNSYDTYWFTTYYSDTQIKSEGTLIVDNNISNEAKMTVESDAFLFVKGNLSVGEDGSLTLCEDSNTIVEGNLSQTYSSVVGWLISDIGDVTANNATMVVGGDYIISDGLLGTNPNAKVINPEDNENFVVLGENDLDKIQGIDVSVLEERKNEFIANNGNDLSAYAAIVMPIELVYFEAYNSGDQVYFKWQTASELNNDYFTIECSTDAEDFESLATIQGSGTTNYTVDYDYQYRLNYVGTMYYRLKQTDYDGSSTYSKTEAVTFAAKAVKKADDFTIYPNPAVDFVTIAGGEYESVAFVSADGKIMSEQAPQNSHSVEMLPKGLNIVVIRTVNGNVSKTIIKQ
ncbi:MAG: T9SS type A sorting domain-containing protein [Salinivirgaceae bacterium]|nr:T9SS type A sorting domain-containing protein [Salinivirgaceae bacterium]